MSKNVTIEFTTDEEAVLVYNALRYLKRKGYTQSFTIGDDSATVNIADDTDIDNVLQVFHDLKNVGNHNINAFEEG